MLLLAISLFLLLARWLGFPLLLLAFHFLERFRNLLLIQLVVVVVVVIAASAIFINRIGIFCLARSISAARFLLLRDTLLLDQSLTLMRTLIVLSREGRLYLAVDIAKFVRFLVKICLLYTSPSPRD